MTAIDTVEDELNRNAKLEKTGVKSYEAMDKSTIQGYDLVFELNEAKRASLRRLFLNCLKNPRDETLKGSTIPSPTILTHESEGRRYHW
jgi:hypothetical protein